MIRRMIAILISLSMLLQQIGFAQIGSQPVVSSYMLSLLPVDAFRPVQMRSLSFDTVSGAATLFVDKGSIENTTGEQLEQSVDRLMDFFYVGLALPNSCFWVNLRPDAQDQIIDPLLEKTDLGKILLEADLQLKKDLAALTSPKTPQGKAYWDKLYARAESLFGQENAEIPTHTRPWIVPGEIIIKETPTGAYVYKAGLKVMLEEDYAKDTKEGQAQLATGATFDDPRLQQLNDYSTQLIRSTILPMLTRQVNASRKYAQLRQAYYSLVLAQWFKTKRVGSQSLLKRIDSKDLSGLTSKNVWSKQTYFNDYKKSFENGEYAMEDTVATPSGLTVRKYFSGGLNFQAPPGWMSFKGQDAAIDRSLVQVQLSGNTNDGGAFVYNKDQLSDPANAAIIADQAYAASRNAEKINVIVTDERGSERKIVLLAFARGEGFARAVREWSSLTFYPRDIEGIQYTNVYWGSEAAHAQAKFRGAGLKITALRFESADTSKDIKELGKARQRRSWWISGKFDANTDRDSLSPQDRRDYDMLLDRDGGSSVDQAFKELVQAQEAVQNEAVRKKLAEIRDMVKNGAYIRSSEQRVILDQLSKSFFEETRQIREAESYRDDKASIVSDILDAVQQGSEKRLADLCYDLENLHRHSLIRKYRTRIITDHPADEYEIRDWTPALHKVENTLGETDQEARYNLENGNYQLRHFVQEGGDYLFYLDFTPKGLKARFGAPKEIKVLREEINSSESFEFKEEVQHKIDNFFWTRGHKFRSDVLQLAKPWKNDVQLREGEFVLVVDAPHVYRDVAGVPSLFNLETRTMVAAADVLKSGKPLSVIPVTVDLRDAAAGHEYLWSKSTEELIDLFRQNDTNPGLQADVLTVLARTPPVKAKETVISLALGALENKSAYVREAGAFTLGKIGNADVVPALRKAFKADEWKGTTGVLVAILNDRRSPDVLAAIINAFRDIKSPRATGLLLEVISNYRGDFIPLHRLAEKALVEIADQRAYFFLKMIENMDTEHKNSQRSAWWAATRALDALKKSNDKDGGIGEQESAEALAKMRTQMLASMIEEHLEEQSADMEQLQKMLFRDFSLNDLIIAVKPEGPRSAVITTSLGDTMRVAFAGQDVSVTVLEAAVLKGGVDALRKDIIWEQAPESLALRALISGLDYQLHRADHGTHLAMSLHNAAISSAKKKLAAFIEEQGLEKSAIHLGADPDADFEALKDGDILFVNRGTDHWCIGMYRAEGSTPNDLRYAPIIGATIISGGHTANTSNTKVYPAIPHNTGDYIAVLEEMAGVKVDRDGGRSVDALIADLKNVLLPKAEREKAAVALIAQKRRAVEPLIEVLSVKDEFAVVQAAQALGEIGNEKAIEPLRCQSVQWASNTEAYSAIAKVLLRLRREAYIKAAEKEGAQKEGQRRAAAGKARRQKDHDEKTGRELIGESWSSWRSGLERAETDRAYKENRSFPNFVRENDSRDGGKSNENAALEGVYHELFRSVLMEKLPSVASNKKLELTNIEQEALLMELTLPQEDSLVAIITVLDRLEAGQIEQLKVMARTSAELQQRNIDRQLEAALQLRSTLGLLNATKDGGKISMEARIRYIIKDAEDAVDEKYSGLHFGDRMYFNQEQDDYDSPHAYYAKRRLADLGVSAIPVLKWFIKQAVSHPRQKVLIEAAIELIKKESKQPVSWDWRNVGQEITALRESVDFSRSTIEKSIENLKGQARKEASAYLEAFIYPVYFAETFSEWIEQRDILFYKGVPYELEYINWLYSSNGSSMDLELRDLATGKKIEVSFPLDKKIEGLSLLPLVAPEVVDQLKDGGSEDHTKIIGDFQQYMRNIRSSYKNGISGNAQEAALKAYLDKEYLREMKSIESMLNKVEKEGVWNYARDFFPAEMLDSSMSGLLEAAKHTDMPLREEFQQYMLSVFEETLCLLNALGKRHTPVQSIPGGMSSMLDGRLRRDMDKLEGPVQKAVKGLWSDFGSGKLALTVKAAAAPEKPLSGKVYDIAELMELMDSEHHSPISDRYELFGSGNSFKRLKVWDLIRLARWHTQDKKLLSEAKLEELVDQVYFSFPDESDTIKMMFDRIQELKDTPLDYQALEILRDSSNAMKCFTVLFRHNEQVYLSEVLAYLEEKGGKPDNLFDAIIALNHSGIDEQFILRGFYDAVDFIHEINDLKMSIDTLEQILLQGDTERVRQLHHVGKVAVGMVYMELDEYREQVLEAIHKIKALGGFNAVNFLRADTKGDYWGGKQLALLYDSLRYMSSYDGGLSFDLAQGAIEMLINADPALIGMINGLFRPKRSTRLSYFEGALYAALEKAYKTKPLGRPCSSQMTSRNIADITPGDWLFTLDEGLVHPEQIKVYAGRVSVGGAVPRIGSVIVRSMERPSPLIKSPGDEGSNCIAIEIANAGLTVDDHTMKESAEYAAAVRRADTLAGQLRELLVQEKTTYSELCVRKFNAAELNDSIVSFMLWPEMLGELVTSSYELMWVRFYRDGFVREVTPLRVPVDYDGVRVIDVSRKDGGKVTEQLIQLMAEDADKNIRIQAAIALGASGDAKAVEPLLKALVGARLLARSDASYEGLLAAIIAALGEIGDSKAAGSLVEVLQSSRKGDGNIRAVAAKAVGKTAKPLDSRAIAALIGVLEEPAAVGQAALALGKIGDQSAVEPLKAELARLRNSWTSDKARILLALERLYARGYKDLEAESKQSDREYNLKRKWEEEQEKAREKAAHEEHLRRLRTDSQYALFNDPARDGGLILQKRKDNERSKDDKLARLRELADEIPTLASREQDSSKRWAVVKEALDLVYLLENNEFSVSYPRPDKDPEEIKPGDIFVSLGEVGVITEIKDGRISYTSLVNDKYRSIGTVGGHPLSDFGRYFQVIPLAPIEEPAGVKHDGGKSIDSLMATLKNRLLPKEERRKAADALTDEGARAVESFIEVLSVKDEFVVVQAAQALGKIGDEKAVEPLKIQREQWQPHTDAYSAMLQAWERIEAKQKAEQEKREQIEKDRKEKERKEKEERERRERRERKSRVSYSSDDSGPQSYADYLEETYGDIQLTGGAGSYDDDDPTRDGGKNFGGVDFRVLPADPVGAAMGMPAVDAAAIKALADSSKMTNLDKEWSEIVKLIQARSMPCEKVKEFVAVCSVRQGAHDKLAMAQEVILETIKMQEACAIETTVQERELLVLLESI